MATITTTQAGSLTDAATYVGGAAPSDGDIVLIKHAVTVEANFTQAATELKIDKVDSSNPGSLDTRNAAGTTNYNLVISKLNMWEPNTSCNLRNGTHSAMANDTSATGFYSRYDTTLITMEDGCVFSSNSFRLLGKLTIASGSATMNWGGGVQCDMENISLMGRGEGDYNDGTGWEDNCSRVKLIIDATGISGSGANQYMSWVDQDSSVDDDGPMIWAWNQITSTQIPSRRIDVVYDDASNEWCFTNALTFDIGKGGHGISGEGNLTVLGGYYQCGYNGTNSKATAHRIRGNLTVGDAGTTNCWFKCGASSGSNLYDAYVRVDGNTHLNGGALGVNYKASLYLPTFNHEDPDSQVTDANSLKGAFICLGSFTNEGQVWTEDNNGQDLLAVLGGDSDVYKIACGGGDTSSADGYDGMQDGNGQFTLGNWQEIAISDQCPGGTSLGTKPDSGSMGIQILHLGGSEGSNFIIDEDVTFTSVTIDSGATLTINVGATLTHTGTFTTNGTLTNNGTIVDNSETKAHAAFGRGDGGKTSFQFEILSDLDQTNWVESYFLDQDNRLG